MNRLIGALVIFAATWALIGVVVAVILLLKPLGFWGFPILWTALVALIFGDDAGEGVRQWWAGRK